MACLVFLVHQVNVAERKEHLDLEGAFGFQFLKISRICEPQNLDLFSSSCRNVGIYVSAGHYSRLKF